MRIKLERLKNKKRGEIEKTFVILQFSQNKKQIVIKRTYNKYVGKKN